MTSAVRSGFASSTRKVRPVGELIRFVVGPDGSVVPDLKRKLPGRGVWVTATRPAIEDAVKRNAFARSFKAKVQVAPDLAARVEELLTRSCLDALAIAHKSGRVAIGFAKTEAALADKRVAAAIHASDAVRGRGPEACGGGPASLRGRDGRDFRHFGVHLGAIGFGIGAVKCGTCSPARRPRERRVHIALPKPRTVPGGRSGRSRPRAALNIEKVQDRNGMATETKTPGDKTLSVSSTKTLTLKPRSETSVVRQSFSHGRQKNVVLEVVKRRTVGPAPAKVETKAAEPAVDRGATQRRPTARGTPQPPPRPARRARPQRPPRRSPASSCAR